MSRKSEKCRRTQNAMFPVYLVEGPSVEVDEYVVHLL